MTYSDAYDPLDGIAIIGMAGRFPDRRTSAALWQNLLARRECIARFEPEELEPARREDMLARSSPNYVRARGVLAGADEFDEEFFGFTPREADDPRSAAASFHAGRVGSDRACGLRRAALRRPDRRVRGRDDEQLLPGEPAVAQRRHRPAGPADDR